MGRDFRLNRSFDFESYLTLRAGLRSATPGTREFRETMMARTVSSGWAAVISRVALRSLFRHFFAMRLFHLEKFPNDIAPGRGRSFCARD